ncbi:MULTISPECIES: flavin reductase family protein [Ramlibacter]|uniref:Flavin reductase n=1 Tax=Ramlibacter pinisoli TaxID=2682844 RepID=A0A6N8IVY1_9BURK|nr:MULTISPECIES: flavin reductase family protein [Ramlibacter]MBA2961002.1 flavin reductase family protein [Ramlibacter sp. CGMCC 1.13660]MVQ30948.1 flavin reductase [Ramlibacter pinisoli]
MRSALDPLDLRRAFGRFATGVTVVTFRLDDGRRVGITANSFASVSLDPPLVSWNYRRASPHLQAVLACRHFVVHVLSAEQIELSRRMAQPAADKFAGLVLQEGVGGTPRIPGSLATFECEAWKTIDAGDHVIFLGHVLHYEHTEGEPLVFVNGRYAPGAQAMAGGAA